MENILSSLIVHQHILSAVITVDGFRRTSSFYSQRFLVMRGAKVFQTIARLGLPLRKFSYATSEFSSNSGNTKCFRFFTSIAGNEKRKNFPQ